MHLVVIHLLVFLHLFCFYTVPPLQTSLHCGEHSSVLSSNCFELTKDLPLFSQGIGDMHLFDQLWQRLVLVLQDLLSMLG